MIEEKIPEEKGPLGKYDALKPDEVKETPEDIEKHYKTERGPTRQMKEDVVKDTKLNITDYEIAPKESEQVEERVTTSHTEKPEKYQKVI